MRIRMSRIITLILVFVFVQSFSSSFLISDQGTDVKDTSTGNLTALANLTISIYDSSTGGNLLFEEAFTNAIVNGSWNVMINPNLQYGGLYWKDYKINNEDLSFDGNDRLEFQSSFGRVNNISFINFSLINSCPVGSSIRVIHENGSVDCQIDNSGSGSGNYSDTWINSTIDNKISINNNSIVNWINNIFVSISTLVNRVGNWSADKGNYYNTTQVNSINASMKNYVDYVNSTNGAGSGSYSDAWINQTIYNKTQVDAQNTSQTNYINSNNASIINYLNSNNNSINNYILYVNSTNGAGGSGIDTFVYNYSTFLTHINWETVMNGTLFKTSQWNSTNTSYMTEDNFTIQNNSLRNYILYVNSTNTGTNGSQGIAGLNGLNGTDGTNGINGFNGTNGTNGTNGLNGTNGINGLN